MSDINKIGWRFDNTYVNLPENMVSKQEPVPVKSPKIVILNENLATELGLNFVNIDENTLSSLFSGNLLPNGSETISQAYAGHQFGHFTILGDGRAIILGEHLNKKNKRFDIQFKGSGKTPYSRNGDGRAALAPMLREYLISEAMYHLGIPTTRSLAVVKTGETVVREKPLTGAILTRVAESHIRVGTFQYASISKDEDNLKTLLNYSIERHYPHIKNSENPAIEILDIVIEKQVKLVTEWMRVGFIHGVMNTDNMAISGETIDYGPCAFMDHYDPKTVFSSIDKFGRYAFSNQPPITKWNLARFAECLIPLIDKDEDTAIKLATDLIDNFQNIYEDKWLNMIRDKLGLFGEEKNDKKLINDLFNWMEKNKADYTNTFCHLMGINSDEVYKNVEFVNWKNEWKKRSELNNSTKEKQIKLMKKNNPTVIPRNHKVEEALAEADKGSLDKMKKLLAILKNPYDNQNNIQEYQTPAPSNNEKYQTFCGT